jgi:SAM-dependent methyltransferase
MQTEPDGYVLAREDSEYARLDRQAAVWEEVTRTTLARAGLSMGQRCVDVGCGTGSVMRLLGAGVGPSGSVLGVDLDERIGRLTLDILEREQPGRHAFMHLDLNASDGIPGAPYDLVYTRLVILHMPDPVATLRKLWAAVAPGGVLVVMDFDLSVIRGVPSNPRIERGVDVMRAIFSRAGRDISIGVNLPVHFGAAGIGVPDRADVAGMIVPIGMAMSLLRSALRSLKPAGVAMGVIDDPAFEALDADLEQHAATPGFARLPDMVSVIKRKPRRSP